MTLADTHLQLWARRKWRRLYDERSGARASRDDVFCGFVAGLLLGHESRAVLTPAGVVILEGSPRYRGLVGLRPAPAGAL